MCALDKGEMQNVQCAKGASRNVSSLDDKTMRNQDRTAGRERLLGNMSTNVWQDKIPCIDHCP